MKSNFILPNSSNRPHVLRVGDSIPIFSVVSIFVSLFTPASLVQTMFFTSIESTWRSTLSTQRLERVGSIIAIEDVSCFCLVIFHNKSGFERLFLETAVVWLSLERFGNSSLGRRRVNIRRQRCRFQSLPTQKKSYNPSIQLRGKNCKKVTFPSRLQYFCSWWCNTCAKFCVYVNGSQSQRT